MINRTLGSYGAPYSNAEVITDPTSEADAELYNRLSEDAAQMTRTIDRAEFSFATVASGAATVTSSTTATVWGTGGTHDPIVARTATGTYTATFPTTKTDALSVVEAVGFLRGRGQVASGTIFGLVQVTVSGSVATIYIFDATHALADITAGTVIDIWLR